MAQFQERKSWMTSQRQSFGPDWATRCHPDSLNRDIEKVVRDMYFGNIGVADTVSNPDFKDLCSQEITTALYNYYLSKITAMAPLITIMEEHKVNRIQRIQTTFGQEYQAEELQKFQEELNNSNTWHFMYECYEYYCNALTLINGFISSGYTNDTFMSNLCRLVFKGNNHWGNPGVRFF